MAGIGGSVSDFRATVNGPHSQKPSETAARDPAGSSLGRPFQRPHRGAVVASACLNFGLWDWLAVTSAETWRRLRFEL